MSKTNRNSRAGTGQQAASSSKRFTIMHRLLQLPRFVRILIVIVIAVLVVLPIIPTIDAVYVDYFFSPDTVIVPSLVLAAVGLLMYLAGWRWFVGTVGEPPPMRRVLWWYFGIALLAVMIDVILIVQGLAMVRAADAI